MGLLQKATVEQAAVKIGGYGPQGSGKTTTLALLAIGLSIAHHKSAPVVMCSTEPGVDFLVPIFEAEGVPLFTVKSRAFKDMCRGLAEAQQAGACVYFIDSYTHPWKELVDSFKRKSNRNRLEIHHMDELKRLWQAWVDQMLGSPLHVLLSGRLGNVWDNEVDDEDGRNKLVRLGSKMKGESDAGYEPHLLFEIESIDDPTKAGRDKKTKRRVSGRVHNLTVVKDRWRDLNGKTFTFTDINAYKKGDWKKVYDVFKPHIAHFNIGGVHRGVDGTRSSEELLAGPDDSALWRRKKDIALEEVRESIAAVFPGQTGAEKRARQVVLESLFQTLAWTKVEVQKLEDLERAALVLKEFRGRAARERDDLESEPGIIAELEVCKDIVRERGIADNTPESVDDDVPV